MGAQLTVLSRLISTSAIFDQLQQQFFASNCMNHGLNVALTEQCVAADAALEPDNKAVRASA